MKSKFLPLTLLEDIVGTENRFLLWCWCSCVALILILGFVFGSSNISFMGVADSREYQVNFDSSVEIKKIYVQPGQVVKEGDLLAELSQSELEAQIRTLKSKKEMLEAELKLRSEIAEITRIRSRLSSAMDPLFTEVDEIRKEIALLEDKRKDLFVFSDLDGTVGAVNFKDGEKAASFAPIITLMPHSPSYVNGYINENLGSTLEAGQTVQVISSTGKKVTGIVKSIGSRMVQIPPRLLHIQTLQAWGREVSVRIPPQNGFLLGERVTVEKPWGVSFLSTAKADEVEKAWQRSIVEPKSVKLPPAISKMFNPEMSGMVFLEDIKQFAVVADDYPQNRPFLLLMNEKGEVQNHTMEIKGLERIDDIESISSQGEYLYLMGSLSPTKKGRKKSERELFVKLKRKGFDLEKIASVHLLEPLIKAMQNSDSEDLKSLARKAESEGLEIEGHAVWEDDLYLALKGPTLKRNEACILKLANFDRVFANSSFPSEALTVVARFEMSLGSKDPELVVTDLILDRDHIYLSSSCRGISCSAVWRLSRDSRKTELVHEFKESHLEGLALQGKMDQLFGVFDLKSGPQFVSIHLNHSPEKP